MGNEGLHILSTRRAMDKSIASLRSADAFFSFPSPECTQIRLNKKSIILTNNAFIRVGNEGLHILSTRREMDKSIASLRFADAFF